MEQHFTCWESRFYSSSGHELVWLAPGAGHVRENGTWCDLLSRWQLLPGVRQDLVLLSLCRMVSHSTTVDVLAKSWTDSKMAGRTEDKRTQNLIVHEDNVPLHTASVSFDFMEANWMKKAPYSPYSPDLIRPDWVRFGHVKWMLRGCVSRTANKRLSAMIRILIGVEILVVVAGFQKQMRTPQLDAHTQGEYSKWSKKLVQMTFVFVNRA
jgi:hypothetical protein